MRIKFTEPFDYTPSEEPRVTLAYSPKGGANKDGEYTVRQECGEAAVTQGKGVEVPAPKRKSADSAEA